jgi:DNA-binding transcriptional LysR family regulator
MVRLEDLDIFVRTADGGSLSAAARTLNISPAVASAALKRLETELGARLLARSTRSLRLTPDGEQYLAHARSALAELAAGKDRIARHQGSIGGKIALSIPSDLGRNLLIGWLDTFQAQYPRVELQIRVGDQLADMYRQAVDLVVRYGAPDDSTLIALPLAPANRRVLCASPAYFERFGRPATPQALREHNCLRFSLSGLPHANWTFGEGEQASVVSVTGDRLSDDGELVRRWAIAGHGIAYKSRLDVLDALRSGQLVTALDDHLGEFAPLHMLSTHRLMLSPTANTLRTFLQERIHAYLDGPMPG